MSEKRGFIAFLVNLLAPFVLIALGAGMVGIGFSQGMNWLTISGGVVAGCGVLWGAFLLLFHGPLDW